MILRRFCKLAAATLVALSACKIERTPESYIDPIDTPAGEIEASREELTDRLIATAAAAQRRDNPALIAALVPLSGAGFFGLEADEDSTSNAPVNALVDLFSQGEVAMTEPVVEVGPGNNVAWFSTTYEVSAAPLDAASVRFSGVFIRQEGEWRLAQGHLSRATPPTLPNPALPAAPDTAAGGG